jgi:hypothetical protein
VPEYEHQVRDGDRTLQFDGDLLATSSSYRKGNPRWVEFELYRTRRGAYILSRIGQTRVVHAPDCEVVEWYHLRPGQPPRDAESCDRCRPGDVGICPERVRYWAQVMEEPTAVVEALMKYDSAGTRYLTYVAQRLLADASVVDPGIAGAYNVEVVA